MHKLPNDKPPAVQSASFGYGPVRFCSTRGLTSEAEAIASEFIKHSPLGSHEGVERSRIVLPSIDPIDPSRHLA